MNRGRMTNIELKELIELHLTSIRNEIKSGNDMLEYKISEITYKVKALELDYNVTQKHLKTMDWVDRNKRLLIVLAVIFWFVLDIASKSIELIDVLKIVK